MDRGFRLGIVLCGLMSGDFIVSSHVEQIRKDNIEVLTVASLVTAQSFSPFDCSTGGTPKKPTPSPKNPCQDFCDDDLGGNYQLPSQDSIHDLLNNNVETSSSAASSPTSTNGQFNSEKSSLNGTPAITFSGSPSTTSLPDLDLGQRQDCTTGGTPEKPSPSPKTSSPKK